MRQGRSPSPPSRARRSKPAPEPDAPAQAGPAPRAPRHSRSRSGKPPAAPVTPAATPSPRPTRDPAATHAALLDAARAEFDEHGFEGTDTNRIAGRAGYAPQTFYRHFADKTAVFVATYERWLDEEWKDLARAHGRGAEEAARILLQHHAEHRGFRRSLRRLTVTDETVRAARAASRRRQLELVEAQDLAGGRARDRRVRVALLFAIERIADAAADGELGDLGLSAAEEVELLADVLRRFAREA